jgi:hypothetical protein
MSYCIRAFCTTATVPTISAFLAWLRQHGSSEAEVLGESPRTLQSPAWKAFELVYQPDIESVLVECYRKTDKSSQCRRMIQEELDALEDVENSETKAQVADCLMRTKFIIWCRVDRDPRRAEAAHVRALLDFFVDHCGALLDEEDEGFYSCSDTPLLGRCAED